MKKPTFSFDAATPFFEELELSRAGKRAALAMDELEQKTGKGNDFLGWLDLPYSYDKEEFKRVQETAQKIRREYEAMVVIGIGGSYLGARAAIEFLKGSFANMKNDGNPKIFFAGNNVSPSYHYELMEIVKDMNFCVNVISKSGKTTEPAIAFRLFKEMLVNKYGADGAGERIFVTTDAEKGALLSLAKDEGYERFTIADDIGGRYSVLSSVGLLPIAVAGGDIAGIMEGAQAAYDDLCEKSFEKNAAMQYAALRNIFLEKGKSIEILVNYEPSLLYFAEWYKQLFGESEGKEGKGLYPSSLNFTADLHSMGQYVQEGSRNVFETIIHIESTKHDIVINEDDKDIDELNFLKGKTMDFVNKKAYLGTMLAHTDGKTPNLIISIDKQDEYNLGYLIYFFEKVCGISGYILGVNPFDQPGVEAYKRNMFALLGKPGFEELQKALEERIN